MSALFPAANGTWLITNANLPSLTASFSYGLFFRPATLTSTHRMIQLSSPGPTLQSTIQLVFGTLSYVSSANTQIGECVVNTWYFAGITHNGPSGTSRGFAAPVGRPLTVTSLGTDNSYSALDEITIGNRGNDNTPFNGEIVGFKFWQFELTDDQMQNEARSIAPRVAPVHRFIPILSTTRPGQDMSGSGFANLTLTGAITESRAMPPIPWRGADPQ